MNESRSFYSVCVVLDFFSQDFFVEIFVGKQKHAGGKVWYRLIPVTQNFTLPVSTYIE